MVLNGATIKDGGNNDLDTTLPTVGSGHSIINYGIIHIKATNPTLYASADTSNGTDTKAATDGDTITFEIRASDALDFNSISATTSLSTNLSFSLSSAANHEYQATYTVSSADPEGEINWAVSATDTSTNAGITSGNPSGNYSTYNTVSNVISSVITIDRTPPTLVTSTSLSINEGETSVGNITSNELSFISISGGPDAALFNSLGYTSQTAGSI